MCEKRMEICRLPKGLTRGKLLPMPIIKSAKKKMRKDKKRTLRNDLIQKDLKSLLKNARREPSVKTFSAVFSKLDKAVKTHLVHANTAARLKSRLAKSAVTKSA